MMSEKSNYNRAPLYELLAIIILELLSALIIFYINNAYVINRPYIYSDYGIYDLNASPAQMMLFQNQFPLANLFAQLSYHITKSLYSLLWNLMLIGLQIFMPLSMFFFLKQLNFTLISRTLASFFYLVNPFSLSYGFGNEYSIYLIFVPLILGYLTKYSEDHRRLDLLKASVASFLLFSVNGIVQIRYLVIIVVPILLMILVKNKEVSAKKVFLDEVIALILFFLISIPLILHLYQNLSIFSQSYSSNLGFVKQEIGTVQYVFQSSNLFVSFLGVTTYPGTLLNSIGYTDSWAGFLYFFLIVGGIISSILYKGARKSLYVTMLILLAVLVSFQYLVHIGTLVFLYKFPIFDVYNYPSFFQLTQVIIYTVIFGELVESITTYTKRIRHGSKLSGRHGKLISCLILGTMLILIFSASFPVIIATNTSNTTSVGVSLAPGYINNLTGILEEDQTSITLILPNNLTTLSYLDISIPYGNVYGLPYDYQAFPVDFPNSSIFYNLSLGFQNNNINKVKEILSSEYISTVVILNPQLNSTIRASSTSISGGGKNFANVINETGLYNLTIRTSDYYIYSNNSLNHSHIIGITFGQIFTITYNIISIPAAITFLLYNRRKTKLY
jgi:hypothetical protein